MKKVNLFAIVLIGLSFLHQSATAQTEKTTGKRSKGIVYSVALDGNLGDGQFKDSYKWGAGGKIQADIPVTQGLYAIVNVGYLNFFGRDIKKNNTTISITDAGFLPVKVGLKYFPLGILYVQADAGVSFLLNKEKVNYGSSAAFIYSPQIGVRLPFNEKNSLDIGVLYERSTKFTKTVSSSQVSFYGVQIAYTFPL